MGKKSGGFAQIATAQRKSFPRMQKLAAKVDVEKVKKHWLNNENDALIEYAKSLATV